MLAWLKDVRRRSQLAKLSDSGYACGFCETPLAQLEHLEEDSHERGGNARARTRYQCKRCLRRFSQVVHESFSGNTESWSVQREGRWRSLDEAQCPCLRRR